MPLSDGWVQLIRAPTTVNALARTQDVSRSCRHFSSVDTSCDSAQQSGPNPNTEPGSAISKLHWESWVPRTPQVKGELQAALERKKTP